MKQIADMAGIKLSRLHYRNKRNRRRDSGTKLPRQRSFISLLPSSPLPLSCITIPVHSAGQGSPRLSNDDKEWSKCHAMFSGTEDIRNVDKCFGLTSLAHQHRKDQASQTSFVPFLFILYSSVGLDSRRQDLDDGFVSPRPRYRPASWNPVHLSVKVVLPPNDNRVSCEILVKDFAMVRLSFCCTKTPEWRSQEKKAFAAGNLVCSGAPRVEVSGSFELVIELDICTPTFSRLIADIRNDDDPRKGLIGCGSQGGTILIREVYRGLNRPSNFHSVQSVVNVFCNRKMRHSSPANRSSQSSVLNVRLVSLPILITEQRGDPPRVLTRSMRSDLNRKEVNQIPSNSIYVLDVLSDIRKNPSVGVDVDDRALACGGNWELERASPAPLALGVLAMD
ncbi:uncharacterized protein BT62DRAFT_1007525 [Guyanagaster necrorhizus]|uniref:Uncharacterized protein n=1 Tax=Guyanagaster necrorhizus TaxID=856835 RepID=A0A9P7VR22_9AGAR|nr:uncharacterized protein BT62DRAFT_1007525 [Guyanagaster necrorhizus MCA 3950]KAG7445135.1 hypothetical protein BT62DRAFT_1007525 [Guyanagaster necrorhizus MCA 3950]